MKPSREKVNELKLILENLFSPEKLDNHPWTKSLLVNKAIENDPGLRQKSPGYQLVMVVSDCFRQMMPNNPPSHGKRLDTRWCQFGMLAAQYFAPFLHGSIHPQSLGEAWGRMDEAILKFVYNKPDEQLTDEELTRYSLFNDQTESAPYSTLSDWHNRGLERLTEIFFNKELFLRQSPPAQGQATSNLQAAPSRKNQRMSTATEPEPTNSQLPATKKRRMVKRLVLTFILVLLLTSGLWVGLKGWRIIQNINLLKTDLNQIQGKKNILPFLTFLEEAGPLLTKTRQDVETLKAELEPSMWLTRSLDWFPQFGSDISAVEPMLELITGLSTAADDTYQSLMPLLQTFLGNDHNSNLVGITRSFLEIQPTLIKANILIDEAMIARAKIDETKLSSYYHDLIINKIDPYLQLFKEGLMISIALPKLMGSGSSGPQVYLLLVQNEDELRATGGFITAVGTIVIKDGAIISADIEDSYALDDLTKPYPLAPWQLEQYMNSRHWLLRDSNWSPDFPTSAALAKYFYAYSRSQPVSGVIALDQKFVSILLSAMGSVNVKDIAYPITAENMVKFIRESKDTAILEGEVEHRKDALGQLADAMFNKLLKDTNVSWVALLENIIAALNQHHLLLSFDEPTIKSVLASTGWDGAISVGNGDFLMVVDSNVGFTKANAGVTVELSYEVDLTNSSAPTGSLRINHQNTASEKIPCLMSGIPGNLYADLINRCYWNYLRVYKNNGTQLLNSLTHAVPAVSTINFEAVPARVDFLDEGIKGIRGFGTYLVVPGGKPVETLFQFLLPPSVIAIDDKGSLFEYHLKIEKQPGTSDVPLSITIYLPKGAVIKQRFPNSGEIINGNWVVSTTLSQDIEINLIFSKP